MLIWAIVIIFLLAIIFLVGGVFLSRRKEKKKSDNTSLPPEKPVNDDACAYLIMLSVDVFPPVVLEYNVTSIGRNDDNDVTIKDPSVSRHHAQIHKNPKGKYSINDLNSLNGIYVNDKPVKKMVLTEGDKIEIGDIKCRFTFTPDTVPISAVPETTQLNHPVR